MRRALASIAIVLALAGSVLAYGSSVANSGLTVCISNYVGSKNFPFHNNGPEAITVQRYNSGGASVGEPVTIPVDGDALVGVNPGDSVKVADAAGAGNGASFTF